MFLNGRSAVFTLLLAALPGGAHCQFVRSDVAVPNLVEEYLRGESHLLAWSPFQGGHCPSFDARRDSILTALLRIEDNDGVMLGLAMASGPTMGRCQEPRVRAWFRDRIGQETNSFFKAALLHAALASGDEEFRQIAMEALGDSTIAEDSRAFIYGDLTRAITSTDEALDIAMTAFERHGSTTVDAVALMLASPSVAARSTSLNRRILDAIERRPGGSDAARLLGVIYATSMNPARRDTGWNAELAERLDRLLELRSADVPPNLRGAINRVLAGIRPRH